MQVRLRRRSSDSANIWIVEVCKGAKLGGWVEVGGKVEGLGKSIKFKETIKLQHGYEMLGKGVS